MKENNNYLYITALLEKGNFTEAAKSLFIAQPSLSQYIKRIEDEIGTELFIRNTKPLQLTDAGIIYLDAQRMINKIRKQAEDQINELNDLQRGSVTIGSSHYRSIFLLTKAIPLFMEKYPNIEVKLEEGRTDYLQDCAINGITDFSIVLTPVKSDILVSEYLFEEKIVVAINKEHDTIKDLNISYPQEEPYPIIDFKVLRDESFIVMKQGQHIRNSFFELCELSNFTPHIIMETDDMATAQSLAATGIGVTIVPDVLARSNLNTVEPAYLCIQQKINPREVIAVYNSKRPMSKAARAFLALIKEESKNLKY